MNSIVSLPIRISFAVLALVRGGGFRSRVGRKGHELRLAAFRIA
jgi:hypothetical protein